MVKVAIYEDELDPVYYLSDTDDDLLFVEVSEEFYTEYKKTAKKFKEFQNELYELSRKMYAKVE